MFKRTQTKATAKFIATGYDAKTGKLVIATDPQFGHSDWVLLFLLSWSNSDYLETERVDIDASGE